MYRPRTVTFSALVVALSVATVAKAASVFPDVPQGHLFQESVEELVRAQVVNGNPDGTFRPDDNVNRAAMLKMLYRAKGKIPDPLSVRCFPDVVIGSWYEPFVCDAAARKYVNGYADGTFRPSDPVNRVEALKMIMTVFGIPLEVMTDDNREIVNFADVSLSAWYTQYLLTAYNTQILPVPGQTGAYFFPDKPLSRGESAAYIYNALHADLNAARTQAQKSSVSSQESTSYSSQTAQQTSSEESSSDDGTVTGVMEESLPFDRSGKFAAKQPVSYKFNVSTAKAVDIEASLQSGQPGQITCRLYLLDESGFSDEYFLGYQEGEKCYIRATLNPGMYQLQLQPSQKDTTFTVNAEEGVGDGNDGFRNARSIAANAERQDVLGASDIEDWYTFSLTSQQRMTVEVANPTELRCIVYAMNDVDLASFSGPQCNQSFLFPPGTYYIAIGRKAPLSALQTYTIKLDK
ncbi:MAG: S-layer homology domain-containing protein [Candidatus Peribacteraceae bacterium]|jgi:hypothetical protein|nr:S-layer homology domain-containing protein [Candidatus Peribacteraceae bacterium]|tara:strand:- start:407 stop:1792 length:1386 start_codon:yes stop_codon:yes gene_type:complete